MKQPDIYFTIAAHIPLLQGENPTYAVMRHAPDDVRVIKVDEIAGRDFEGDVMLKLAITAGNLAKVESVNEVYAHLVFSGSSLGHVEIDDMMAFGWRQESYSYLTIAGTADQARLVVTDESLPMNHFRVPRLALIAALNYAYAKPNQVYLCPSEEQATELRKQLAGFSERAARLPANDPEAIMEFQGEGRVMALCTVLWHHFNAQRVRSNWVREMAA